MTPTPLIIFPSYLFAGYGSGELKITESGVNGFYEYLQGKKGKVEVSFGKPLNALIEGKELPKPNLELFQFIAKEIDKEIHNTYKLMPTNYMAFDLLNDSSSHKEKYSPEEKEKFEKYVLKKIEGVEGDEAFKKDTFLKMYAYPVMNKEA